MVDIKSEDSLSCDGIDDNSTTRSSFGVNISQATVSIYIYIISFFFNLSKLNRSKSHIRKQNKNECINFGKIHLSDEFHNYHHHCANFFLFENLFKFNANQLNLKIVRSKLQYQTTHSLQLLFKYQFKTKAHYCAISISDKAKPAKEILHVLEIETRKMLRSSKKN